MFFFTFPLREKTYYTVESKKKMFCFGTMLLKIHVVVYIARFKSLLYVIMEKVSYPLFIFLSHS